MRWKTVLGALVCLAIGATAMLLFTTSGTIEARAPIGNGDVNGDGRIDMADAVYIISWLFRDGPPAVEILEMGCDDCETELMDCQHALSQSEMGQAQCELDLGQCQGHLASTHQLHAQCEATLAQSLRDLEAREAQVNALNRELANCRADLELFQAVLTDTRGLPATGQTVCHDDGQEIDCNHPDWPGQDGFYQAGFPCENRFADNGDGTVTDIFTGLMWQKDTADVNGDGRITPMDRLNWKDALFYCEHLHFANHDDWRLPNIRELLSILDYHGTLSMLIDPAFGVEGTNYWSSTTCATDTDRAGELCFGSGHMYWTGKWGSEYVRAVRGTTRELPSTGQTRCYGSPIAQADTPVIDCADPDWPGQDGYHQMGFPTEGRFIDHGDGTVTDLSSGLMWQRNTAPGLHTWQNALKYCDQLKLAGHEDWRLPNVRELESIADYGRSRPRVHRVFQTTLGMFWSSSTAPGMPDSALFVESHEGHMFVAFKLNVGHVRAVRGGLSKYHALIADCQRTLMQCQADLASLQTLYLQCSHALEACQTVVECRGLPASGQTACFDDYNAATDCAGLDFPGQDGHYQAGFPSEGRFIDNGDGTVTDQFTGLMWQQEPPPGSYALREALQYCENLTFAGHSDWRLPNVRELESIVDYGRFRPAVNPVFLFDWEWGLFDLGPYWSSSTDVDRPGDNWAVSFNIGSSASVWTASAQLVRAVRGVTRCLPSTGQTRCYYPSGTEISCSALDYPGLDGYYQMGVPSEGRFIDNGDETVSDRLTGLMWQKGQADTNGDGDINAADNLTWQDALAYCENLEFAGHSDWRLPNIRELFSIVDHGRSRPAMDPVFVVPLLSCTVWSSSTNHDFMSTFKSAWGVAFSIGRVDGTTAKTMRRGVRAVRGGL